ncbi:rab3 GTPase-activating protein catalytic subunit isoform X2 [Neoarius graeffei]|uniref:rab3 GTPase-activating protein catalytic subunit isoform X2 n=1 Tax=Neoarius graeffei TaxID=443677 RepID=UPI00298C7A70|nr:rab3 GTPase-activating protein catalytic subunit isoform X2 [Neoarius graeffei]
MAADSDPESEVFEITDFTTASEWERFVSRVEETLNDWKLIGSNVGKPPEKGEYTTGTWEEKSREINFADFKFSITHHYLKQECAESEGKEDNEEDAFPLAMQDLLCMNNDFPPRAHCLVRCQVPLLVQIQQKWRKMYAGECQGPGVRTDFEMVHLRKVPSQYNHLSGLLDIFKAKIGCLLTPLPPINIAIRFTYILQDWQQYSWPQQPPDFDVLLAGEVGGVEFGKLPFGACEDPISELHLATTWPHLTEGIVVDNDVYSDLDPLQAPHWSVRVRKADNPQCLLGDFLVEFLKVCSRKESTDEILGRSSAEEENKENSDITQALSKLTEPTAVPIPKLSVSNMVHSARKHIRRHRRNDQSPLSNDVLNSVLLYLFPDAALDKSDSSEAKAPQSNPGGKSDPDKETEDYNLFSVLKSAPWDCLTYRLALCVCLVNFYHGGVRAVAHLWQEFVLEMRNHWENNYLIYGLPAGPPDLRCCLLHQKLQMLNCCIEHKKARDDLRKNAASENGLPVPQASPGKSWDSWSDSEDEFFECLSDAEDMKDVPADGVKGTGAKIKPEGRMQPHGKLTLLNSNELLYIPVTQEPAPMTEDVLEEQSEVLAKLGTSAEGAHLRARMQSACLLSDMESFKAANPGCSLEDFVRWYSPRDYVEEEVSDEAGGTVVQGSLSARMKIPGNMWVEAWESAKATPARRQRRLFDDTKEAERVLHYLAVQKPSDLTRHLLPCIIHAALLKVKEEEAVEDIASVRKIIPQVSSHASKLLRHPTPDLKKLEDVINQITILEATIARARSLRAKFGLGKGEDTEDLEQFVSSLLEEPEVAVIGAGRGPAGSIIHKLFVSAQRAALLAPLEEEAGRVGGPDERKPAGGGVPDFPPPAGREILLRTCVPRPAPYSKALPQRLFCVLMKEDFRLAGAFSSDTSFF